MKLRNVCSLGVFLFLAGIGLSRWYFYDGHSQNSRWYRDFNRSDWQYGDDSIIDFQEGTYEVSSVDPKKQPTDSELQMSSLFRQDVLKNLKKLGFDRVENAIAAGYKNGPPFDYIHFYNEEFVNDGRILDPERPEFLMYYPTAQGEYTLGGAMFLTEGMQDHGVQFGGQLTYWHFHVTEDVYCWENNIVTEYDEDGQCRGTISNRSPEMVNVWVVDHPQGDFATEMCLPSGSLEGWKGQESWNDMSEKFYKQYMDEFNKKRYLNDT